MQDKPPLDTGSLSPGHARKKLYDEELQFTTLKDGTRVRTHWRMDVYVTDEDRKRLAEIAKGLKPKEKGSRKQLGRKELIGHLLDRYDLPDPEGELPSLPDTGDQRWRFLAIDLIAMLGSSRHVDMALLSQLAWRVGDFIEDVAATKVLGT